MFSRALKRYHSIRHSKNPDPQTQELAEGNGGGEASIPSNPISSAEPRNSENGAYYEPSSETSIKDSSVDSAIDPGTVYNTSGGSTGGYEADSGRLGSGSSGGIHQNYTYSREEPGRRNASPTLGDESRSSGFFHLRGLYPGSGNRRSLSVDRNHFSSNSNQTGNDLKSTDPKSPDAKSPDIKSSEAEKKKHHKSSVGGVRNGTGHKRSSKKLDLNKPLPDPQENRKSQDVSGNHEKSDENIVDEFLNEHYDSHYYGTVTCGFEDEIVPHTRHSVEKGGRRRYHFPHEKILREHEQYLKYIRNTPPDRIVLEFYDVSVYREDLDNLHEDEWLSDNNLSFAYEYLEHTTLKHFKAKSPNMIQLFKPSIAYLLLHAPDVSAVRTALPPADKARFLFLPLNDNPDVEAVEGGTHWSLMVVSVYDRKALYYDSMNNGYVTAAGVQMSKQLSKLLGFHLELVSVATPQQMNGSDCGIIVAEITALLLNRLVSTDGHKPINLGLENVSLLASAGRTFILSKILALSSINTRRTKM